MIELALVVLVCVLSAACLGMTCLAVRVVLAYQKQLALAAELAIRFPYRVNPEDYARLGVADAIAADRTDASDETKAAVAGESAPQPVGPFVDDSPTAMSTDFGTP